MAGLAPKPPFCPLLSAMVPIAASPIQIAGQTGQQIKFDLLRVGCALGADCMLWDAEWEQCGLLSALQMLSENYDGGEGEDDAEAGEAEQAAGEEPEAPSAVEGESNPKDQEARSPEAGSPCQGEAPAAPG
jgi:hypothetical protein